MQENYLAPRQLYLSRTATEKLSTIAWRGILSIRAVTSKPPATACEQVTHNRAGNKIF
jgi:hypothetical protein